MDLIVLVYFIDCGGVLTSSSGVISSPNFPNYYNHSDACAWLIQQPEGFRVNVSNLYVYLKVTPCSG